MIDVFATVLLFGHHSNGVGVVALRQRSGDVRVRNSPVPTALAPVFL